MAPRRNATYRQHPLADDDEDEGQAIRLPVYVSSETFRTKLYAVSYPQRKKELFTKALRSNCRFKRNVSLLEVRVGIDQNSASYDKTKCVGDGGDCGGSRAKRAGLPSEIAQEEVFEGRAHPPTGPLNYAVGKIHEGRLYLTPIDGLLPLTRPLTHMNNRRTAGNADKDIDEDQSATDSEAEGQPVRIKFARPETERQKKRREASAFHREKQIASDVWMHLELYNVIEDGLDEKLHSVFASHIERNGAAASLGSLVEQQDFRQLVLQTIIKKPVEKIDLKNCPETQLVIQRIKELLPFDLQVKAVLLKAFVISHTTLRHIFPTFPLERLVDEASRYAHLMRGNWVVHSEELFVKPASRAARIGSIDVALVKQLRAARDFALAMIEYGFTVSRDDLKAFFKLNVLDVDKVVSTFGALDVDGHTIRLKIGDCDADELFTNAACAQLVCQHKDAWNRRCERLLIELTGGSSKE
ncbi:unnamed protein product, partial [Mesorhabditis spiculigera]